MYFLNQIKDLGMTKFRYHYVLATLVIRFLKHNLYICLTCRIICIFSFNSQGVYELEINDFRLGGATIIGFSIVDYYNINTIKLLSDVLQSGEPLNRIGSIPV